MKHLKLLPALFTLMLVSSCNQGASTSVNGGGSVGGWITPGIGTTYVYQTTSPDTTGTEFDTITILKNGQEIGGKTNVISYSSGSGGNGDTEFYAIESNGDFSVSSGETNDSDGIIVPAFVWETYPTGSRKTTPITPTLNTIEFNDHIVQSDIVAFIASEMLSTPAGTFSTLHVRETNINIDSSLNGNGGSSFSTITDYWFAPSAGFFVRIIINETENGLADPQEEINLFKFSPK